MGLRLARLARGQDSRTVSPERETKSISAETTFDTDIDDIRTLEKVLRTLSEKVSRRMKRAGFGGRTVTLKLKTPDFRIITRSRQPSDPTALADRIFRTAHDLLKRECDGRKFRLLGVGMSELVPIETADPPDLVDPSGARRAKAEGAMDAIRDRFGKDAVKLGLLFDDDGTARPQRDR
jgi:DNA polymerase-4